LVEQRVFNGAEYLDQFYPTWHNKIDLCHFDAGIWSKCIVGQLFTPIAVIKLLPQGSNWLLDHGFVSGYKGDDGKLLTLLWIDQVIVRRKKWF